MSTFVKKVTSAVAGLAVVFSIVSPIAGVSAAFSGLEAAQKLSTLAIIEDQSANPADYRLGDSSSREELSKVISKLAGLTADSSDSAYQDTDFADWSEKYAKALNEAGIAASNPYFNPKATTSKIEALKWVMEARDIETGTGADWMEARVNGAVAAGIATAFSDYNAAVTRGQVFIWAAEAIAADEVAVEGTDPLCELLGICPEDETPTEETPTDPVVVTDGELEVSLSPLSPTAAVVAAGKPRTAVLAFDVTAGSSDVTLDEAAFEYTGLSDDADFSVMALYMGNDKVTKGSTKSFDSDGEVELSFENDTVIMAGETKTLLLTATLTGGTDNVSHEVTLTGLEASADVTLGTVKSVVFGVVNATNTASLKVTVDEDSGKETIGETVVFADIDLEASDKEDVVLKSLTFDFSSGSVDSEDDISDLVLMVEGVEVASNLSLNSDEEVVIDLDYTITADEEVTVKLEGTITGSIGDNLDVILTEVYAIGANTGVIADLTGETPSHTTNSITEVEGSEINVSFDKGDADEAKPNTAEVLVGTLNMEAASDYVVNKITVTATASTGAVSDILADIELDGKGAENESGVATSVATYTFEDINLDAGVEQMLDLVVEIEDSATINGRDITFNIVITEVEDEENDETYTSTLNTILSSNSFDDKKISIETASFKLTQTTISKRDLVLGNGIEILLYEGKLNVGDSDVVSFEDFTFTGTLSATGFTLEDVLDNATLNIGGETVNADDITDNNIEFNSVEIEVAAGSDNVEVTLTAVLKDDEDVNNGDTMYVALADVKADDSNSDEITGTSEVVTNVGGNVVELNDSGSFSIDLVKNGEYQDDIEEVVLAGSMGVALTELVFEAEEENMDVEELRFTLSGAFDTTVKNVRIMSGSDTIVSGGVVTLSGSTTVIEFTDFTVEDTGSEIDATLVADLEIITTEGGVATATAGDIVVLALTTADMVVEGESSNDPITVTTPGTTDSSKVSVVPVLITAAVANSLGDNDEYAQVTFDVDFGSNDLDNDNLYLSGVTLEAVTGTPLVRNNEGTLVASSTGATAITVTTIDVNSQISDGDTIEFDANGSDGSEIRVVVNGFDFILDLDNDATFDAGELIKSSNDTTLNFGQYNDVN